MISASEVSIQTEQELDEQLSRPSGLLLKTIRQVRSPLLVLGASGKMGPSLCWMARRAAEAAGHDLRVIAVSRFSDLASRDWLERHGIETVSCDLLDRSEVQRLPDSSNLVYLAGVKFGTQHNPARTWAINTLAPAHVAERFSRSQLVALSSGNVYPFVGCQTHGANEETPPAPIGEYASAALARERIFEYFSRKNETSLVLLRLNYAVELRYGVMVDIARRVWSGEPVSLSQGYLNCIWQGDANDLILRSLALAGSPHLLFNLTGLEVLSVRKLAERLGEWLGRPAIFSSTESDSALLSDARALAALLGLPPTPSDQVLRWTADWIRSGGRYLGKPTHFEERSGRY